MLLSQLSAYVYIIYIKVFIDYIIECAHVLFDSLIIMRPLSGLPIAYNISESDAYIIGAHICGPKHLSATIIYFQDKSVRGFALFKR